MKLSPAILLCTFLQCVVAQAIQATEVELDRFENTTICGNLVQPMELDIAPDGRIFLIEIAGVVKLIDPATGKMEVVGKIDVTTEQENGLIGLALDPKFAENGWIYLQYSPPDFVGQHISRFKFENGQLDLSSEKLLLKFEEQRRECCHHAGSLEFGPNGDLYIGTGDNTNPFNDSNGYAPLDGRENRQAWDSQRTAGNTKSYNGKILRIHPEADGTYSIPDGNLFPKDGSVGHPEIYVMGCRNPWRINIDQKTGILYWGDIGPDAGQDSARGPRGYDEINQAKQAGFFGWPYFIGNNFAYAMTDFKSGENLPAQDPASPVNESPNNTGARELPPAQPALIYYPSAPTELFPALGSGGRSACAGPVYYFDEGLDSQTKFPEAFNRTLFAFEWTRHAIYTVQLDENSNVISVERFLPDMKFVRPIDMQFDANGALYVIEYGETWGVNPDAKLTRIDYVRGNRKPIAVAKASESIGREPLAVQFSGEGSYDKDGDSLAYEWTSIKSVGAQAEREVIGKTAEVSTSFDAPGVYTVELAVVDPSGARAITSLPIIVGNSRPEVSFLTPREGDFFTPGEPVAYSIKVRDLEDGTSDFDEADEGDLEPIEANAPSRLFVEAVPVVVEEGAAAVHPGLELIRKSDCLNCHAASRKLVGPTFVEIATKYRDEPHQFDLSVKRVLEGSTGVWGKVAMLPHSQHTPQQIQQMVEYVFSVTADAANPSSVGFQNELPTNSKVATIALEATYTDLGRGEVPALIGSGKVQLRSRRIQAEAADEIGGAAKMNSFRAEGRQVVGRINHQGFLRFNSIAMDQVSQVKVKAASTGPSGVIEVRVGGVDGALLGSANVDANSQRERYSEKTIELDKSSVTDSVADIYLVIKNEEAEGPLMSIDVVEFLK